MRVAPVIMSLALGTVAEAQFVDAHGYDAVKQHAIRSSVNHLDDQLVVSLPPQHATDPPPIGLFVALDLADLCPAGPLSRPADARP